MIQNKRKQRKKRFDEIEYRLRESCQKGDFESIKFNLSEKVQNESKELTFKIDKTNKTALLFQVNKQIDHLIIPTNSNLQVIGEYAFLNCDNLIKVEYDDCPLLYLVLEIAECFLDLQDHCCICRKEIPTGLKPTICDSQFCNYRFTQVGVGLSVAQEIQRDPLAADLIFSIFASAIGSKYFNPRPPDYSDSDLLTMIDKFPRMDDLAKCSNDAELLKLISMPQLKLLRWVLLSNRSQMISLGSKLRLPIFGSNTFQFLSLISTPIAEQKFKALKEVYNSMYLFHGSSTENWHSILRNGLKNASGTAMMANGSAYGSGIYFAHESSVSQGYAHSCQNGYANSKLGSNLRILALCEIAKVPELLHHGWAHTLAKEEACIVRFLLVNGDYHTDVMKSPPKNVPKLKDVLNMEAEKK